MSPLWRSRWVTISPPRRASLASPTVSTVARPCVSGRGGLSAIARAAARQCAPVAVMVGLVARGMKWRAAMVPSSGAAARRPDLGVTDFETSPRPINSPARRRIASPWSKRPRLLSNSFALA